MGKFSKSEPSDNDRIDNFIAVVDKAQMTEVWGKCLEGETPKMIVGEDGISWLLFDDESSFSHFSLKARQFLLRNDDTFLLKVIKSAQRTVPSVLLGCQMLLSELADEFENHLNAKYSAGRVWVHIDNVRVELTDQDIYEYWINASGFHSDVDRAKMHDHLVDTMGGMFDYVAQNHVIKGFTISVRVAAVLKGCISRGEIIVTSHIPSRRQPSTYSIDNYLGPKTHAIRTI